MEPEVSLPCSQEPSTGPYLDQQVWSIHSGPTVRWICIRKVPGTYLNWGLQLSCSRFYVVFLSPVRVVPLIYAMTAFFHIFSSSLLSIIQ
jgi:hypothetical protein